MSLVTLCEILIIAPSRPLLRVGTERRSHSRLWHANLDWFGGATEPFHRFS
jgi:hypothetical protein